jgi:DNA-binding response OmpR family regulator/curved DNA-binding protein CbpA
MGAMKELLIVEDDNTVRELLRDSLISEGFNVHSEKDVEWGLKALERFAPDVLICDLLLPDGSGFDVVREHQNGNRIDPVVTIIMSGVYKGARYEAQALKAGATEFIEKPFPVSALVETLKQALGDGYPGMKTKSLGTGPIDKTKEYALSQTGEPFADDASIKEKQQVERDMTAMRSRPRNIRGDLRKTSFPQLLCQIYRWRATGALLLQKSRVKKIVYFQDGYPVFVKSNVLSECLGRVLVRATMITEEECKDSIQTMKSTGRQQGTVLIETGCLSPHNLVHGLQLQMETKIYDVFSWKQGDYQFSIQTGLSPQTIHLDASVPSLIYEGIKRHASVDALREKLRPHQNRFVDLHSNPLHRFQQLNLADDERTFLAMMNGRSRMRTVLAKSKLEEETAMQLMYALLLSEMIELGPERSTKVETETEDGKKKVARATPPPRPARKNASSAPSTLQDQEPVLEPSEIEGLDTDALRIRLTRRLQHIKKLDCFEVLGVSSSAAVDEIRRAYFALARDVHPDRMRGTPGADVLDLAAQIHQILTNAYELLIDPERREEYQKKKREDTRTGFHRGASLILLAESHYRAGEQSIAEENWGQAVKNLREAVELYPREGEFHSQLGWALFHCSRDNSDEAKAIIEKGIELNPRSEKGYLNMGRILKQEGAKEKALSYFESAIQCNPDNRATAIEMKALMG